MVKLENVRIHAMYHLLLNTGNITLEQPAGWNQLLGNIEKWMDFYGISISLCVCKLSRQRGCCNTHAIVSCVF